MPLSTDALLLLDRIEALEMRSLAWGFTAGSLTEDETLELLGGGVPAEDTLEELLEAHLVSEQTSLSGGRRYRSRFAEAVRLITANRQLFANKPWQGAPRLVADFRVDRRRRRFPRRDRPPDEILADSGATIAPTPVRRAIWNSLTGQAGMRFAAFQERAVVRLSQRVEDGGTIVTAGTGSGKTIAFYLPAMLAIGEAIGPEHWVKALAIYPRVELLKDQFAEAFRMARLTDVALASSGKRPLSIGALFRATPRHGSAQELQDHGWTRRGRDWACPWMRCPSCDGEMLWRGVDLDSGRERLTCARPGCASQVDERHVVLTRQKIQQQPPDLLFTTTEILNQRLSDHWTRPVFGIGSGRKPFIALLDEVHTYAGTGGAQAALTLRRWRHLLGVPVHWAGLSATLGDAARFFADLTGAPIDRVVEISPGSDEFEESGADYQLLLRGELMRLMHRYHESHEEFDCFIVPTVPPPKQQQDTIATLADLHAVGVQPDRIQIIFNMVDDREPLERAFHILLSFLEQRPIASANTDCRVGVNEVYAPVSGMGADLAEMVLHRLRRRHRGATPHPLRQHASRLRQHLLGTRRTVLTIDIAHQQRIDSNDGRSGRQRHGELRSVSGGIARDRSTTAQRSSQGSQTAAGRKRSPRERADLDGENDVVEWVDTASPPPHATIDVLEA